MTALEVDNKYLNAIYQQLMAHARSYNRHLTTYEGDTTEDETAIWAMMKLCEALDIPVELKRGKVQAMGVYDVLTHEPVCLLESLRMYQREERI